MFVKVQMCLQLTTGSNERLFSLTIGYFWEREVETSSNLMNLPTVPTAYLNLYKSLYNQSMAKNKLN